MLRPHVELERNVITKARGDSDEEEEEEEEDDEEQEDRDFQPDRRAERGARADARDMMMDEEDDGFQERVVQVRRVTKVAKGGKSMSFRCAD